jgi:hypothetical protein
MDLVTMTTPIQDEIVGDRRRSGERRCTVLPFSVDRRRQSDRRGGVDRRGASLDTRDQLRAALALLVRAAEDPILDDTTLRQVDMAMVRIWAVVEALERTP